MDGIFMLSFLSVLVGSLLIDRRMLRQETGVIKLTYGLFTFVTISLFISKYLHWRIPMPSRFFLHTVSPWFAHMLGI